jgi:hypothetical protein
MRQSLGTAVFSSAACSASPASGSNPSRAMDGRGRPRRGVRARHRRKGLERDLPVDGRRWRTFNRMDHAIFRALWQWAKRRHPKKSRRWIKDRYFESIGGRHWAFHGTVGGVEDTPQPVRLVAASRMPIRRHTKFKGDANPYDPAWEPYFEERLGVKMAGTLVGRWTPRLLWLEQDGICPVWA